MDNKKILIIGGIIIVVLCIAAFILYGRSTDAGSIETNEIEKYLGIDLAGHDVVAENDSIAVVDIGQIDTEKQFEDWQPIPLSENIELFMFGKEKEAINYILSYAEKKRLGSPENGCYTYIDKYASPDSDREYTVMAMYDADKGYLYFYRSSD